MLETVIAYTVGTAVLLGLIGFLYTTIFRAADWSGPPGTNPQAAVRGVGIALLGGVILGICAIANDNGAGDWIKVLGVLGWVFLGGGFFLMVYGLANNQR
ncbi:MAG: hypothetical protein M1269_02765 [Chloroflexi bacterium]|nr:hypothetical protein [Chloroflexota bacterium]